MCGPALAIIAIAATVASTVVAMQGQAAAGKAAKQNAEYQAQVNDNNAVISENNRQIALRNIDTAGRNRDAATTQALALEKQAQDALAVGQVAEAKKALETKALIGRQRAVLAANGVDVNSGSAVDITSDTAGIGKLDELTIRGNSQRTALSYQLQGANARIGGQNYQTDAENFATAGGNSAIQSVNFGTAAAGQRAAGTNAVAAAGNAETGSALNGIGSVATKWYGFSQAGAGSNPTAAGSSTYGYM